MPMSYTNTNTNTRPCPPWDPFVCPTSIVGRRIRLSISPSHPTPSFCYKTVWMDNQNISPWKTCKTISSPSLWAIGNIAGQPPIAWFWSFCGLHSLQLVNSRGYISTYSAWTLYMALSKLTHYRLQLDRVLKKVLRIGRMWKKYYQFGRNIINLTEILSPVPGNAFASLERSVDRGRA